MHCPFKPLLINSYSIVLYDATSKSHEQRLIIKEHIAIHTNLILVALYSSTLVIKLFNSIKLLFKQILNFLYKLHYLHGTPTFKIEVLHLVSNVQLVKCLYCDMNG